MVPFNHDHDLSLTLTYIFNLNDGRDESDLEGSEKQPMLSFSLRNSVHTEILYPVRVMSFITVTETGSNIFKWGNAIRYSFKVKQSTALFWLRVLPLNKPFVIQACEHMASNWWLFSVSCHRWWPADRLPQSISHRFQLINAAKISRTEERKLPRECGGGGEKTERRERGEKTGGMIYRSLIIIIFFWERQRVTGCSSSASWAKNRGFLGDLQQQYKSQGHVGKVSIEERCKNDDWLFVKCSCFHSQRGIMWTAPRAYFNTLTHSLRSLPHFPPPAPYFWSPTVRLWRHTRNWQLNTAAEIGFMEWARRKKKKEEEEKKKWDEILKGFFSGMGFTALSSSSSVIFARLMMFNNRVRHGT